MLGDLASSGEEGLRKWLLSYLEAWNRIVRGMG